MPPKCKRCGSATDVKHIQIDGAWLWICFDCYMKDDSTSYGFTVQDQASKQ